MVNSFHHCFTPEEPIFEDKESDLHMDPEISAEPPPVDSEQDESNRETQKDTERAALLEKYKIRHVVVDQYQYGRFRYSNLDDAVAQAKRDEPAS